MRTQAFLDRNGVVAFDQRGASEDNPLEQVATAVLQRKLSGELHPVAKQEQDVIVAPDYPLSEVEFVAFDLETTGLSSRSCQIVELGAVRFRLDGTEIGCIEQIVDPGCRIPPAVTRIHGITDAMVRGMPTIASVLPRFLEFLGAPATLLLAHHAPFDIGFLNAAFTRSALECPTHNVCDTLGLARRYVRGTGNHRLETLAIHFGLADFEDHRALSDARLVMGLFLAILRQRRDLRTLQDLLRVTKPLRFAAAPAAPPQPDYPIGLMAAIQQRRVLTILYAGSTGSCFERRVTAQAMVRYGRRSCMVAVCHRDRIEKTYRLDRILRFRIEE